MRFPHVFAAFLGIVPGLEPIAATEQAPDSALTIWFLDVGQADATLISSPEGHTVLIDAGPSGITIATHLDRLGPDTIDLLVASHPHADHIGGMPSVFARSPVRAYLDNGVPHDTRTWRRHMSFVRRSGVTRIPPARQTITLGSMTLTVLPPPPEGSQNNRSVGILVEYGAFRALITGDSEIEELNWWMDRGLIPQVTVLKAAHHGARDAVSPRWISTTRPDVVVISAGRNNPYGHPHAWALRYYRTNNRPVFRTDLHGTVEVVGYADGKWKVFYGR